MSRSPFVFSLKIVLLLNEKKKEQKQAFFFLFFFFSFLPSIKASFCNVLQIEETPLMHTLYNVNTASIKHQLRKAKE